MFNDPILLSQIKRDEGRSPVVYKDTKGLWTIGDGILVDFKVPGAGLRPEEMDFITNNRVGIAAVQTMNIIGPAAWPSLSLPRRRALINMCYNLGAAHFDDFHKAIAAVVAGDFAKAATELQASLWFTEVGARAKRIVNTIKTGVEDHA